MTDWRAQEAEFRARVRDNGRAEEKAPSAGLVLTVNRGGSSASGARDCVRGAAGTFDIFTI
jgi:hypothetical protein